MPRKKYVVKDRTTNRLAKEVSFSNKMDAKTLRNKLNGERADDFVEGTAERFYVTFAK